MSNAFEDIEKSCLYVSFDELNISEPFKWKNVGWIKLAYDTAIADGYVASNHFDGGVIVTKIKILNYSNVV